jgi:serine/threonine-protein kinase
VNDRPTFDGARYVVARVLHESDYATVYEAHDFQTRLPVALKVLRVAGPHREIARAMYRKEVAALEQVEHPAVVRLLGSFEDLEKGVLGIVLEFVPGGRTLEHLLTRVSKGEIARPPLAWRVSELLSLLAALELAHKRGVIHRDIKPANVLCDQPEVGPGHLKLSDFGVARLFENYARKQDQLTLRQFYTRPYASPEQLLQKDATAASDLYAFGVLAAATLALQRPAPLFERQGLGALIAPLERELLELDARAELQQVLHRLLDPEPSARPRAYEVERTLSRILASSRPREVVRVTFVPKARESAVKEGFSGEGAVLTDFEDLRAQYEESPDPQSGIQRPSISCYGRNLQLRLVPANDNPEQLLVVQVRRPPPYMLPHLREKSRALSVRLEVGRGSGAALLDPLYDLYREAERKRAEREANEEMFTLARFILERQRSRLERLRVRYRIDAGRQRKGRSPQRQDFEGTVRVTVVDVRPWDLATEGAADLDLSWADDLDPASEVLLGGRRIGSPKAFEPATAEFAITLTGPVGLATEGELEIRNVAAQTALARQERAIDALFEGTTANPRLAELFRKPEKCSTRPVSIDSLTQTHLRPEGPLRDLVGRVLGVEDLFVLQGPPGTGKTTMIVEIAAQLMSRDPGARILLTSQSHEAVDNAFDRVAELAVSRRTGWRLLREVSEQSKRAPLQGFEQSFRAWTERVRGRSEDAFRQRAGLWSPEKQLAVRSALEPWQTKMADTPDVRNDFAASVQLVAATCLRVPALDRRFPDLAFDWVIVDEAAKATASEVLVPLSYAKRIVLVGDHLQLPPFLSTETTDDLRQAGLSVEQAKRSLFQDLFEKLPATNRDTLRVQKRMHPSIGSLVSELYYSTVGGLENGVEHADRPMPASRFDRSHRVFFIDAPGAAKLDGTSYWNEVELDTVTELVAELSRAGLPSTGGRASMAVIAAYRAQALRISDRLSRAQLRKFAQIGTVNAFQGREAEVVIYSIVRSHEAARFVMDPHLLNVAFSRARALLVLVGQRRDAERAPALKRVLDLIPSTNVLSRPKRST